MTCCDGLSEGWERNKAYLQATPMETYNSIVLNTVSSVAIIFLNKWVFMASKEMQSMGITLTLLHFITTAIGMYICQKMNVFQAKKIELKKVAGLVLSFCGFVVLTNISLQLNSVGFYQLMKVPSTPVTAVIEYFWYNKVLSFKVGASLGVVLTGVVMGTTGDVHLNFWGTVVALSAVVVTSLYQIWAGTKQRELGVDSFQLLYYQAPLSCLVLLPISLIAEPEAFKVLSDPGNGNLLLPIFLTCVCAFFVNLSAFLVLGKTSAITYNILGYLKLSVILLGHFTIFGHPFVPRQVTGIILTIIGVVLYGHYKMQPVPHSAQTASSKVTPAATEEASLSKSSQLVVEVNSIVAARSRLKTMVHSNILTSEEAADALGLLVVPNSPLLLLFSEHDDNLLARSLRLAIEKSQSERRTS